MNEEQIILGITESLDQKSMGESRCAAMSSAIATFVLCVEQFSAADAGTEYSDGKKKKRNKSESSRWAFGPLYVWPNER